MKLIIDITEEDAAALTEHSSIFADHSAYVQPASDKEPAAIYTSTESTGGPIATLVHNDFAEPLALGWQLLGRNWTISRD